MARLVIGTRGSKLALVQTHGIADALRRAHPDLDVDIVTIQTQGDATQAANVPLASFGEKGIFVKELETALLEGTIDLAVHSLKDMAHTLPEGLTIAAVPEREDPRDALIGSTLEALPKGAKVGTGSVRRRALLLSRRPDLQCLEIRGNIDTRLRKLAEGQYDAICLAVAGLSRLGLTEHIAETLDSEWFTPDPGQGALGLEARGNDTATKRLIMTLTDPETYHLVRTERIFLQTLGGGCKTPIGALAVLQEGQICLTGMVASPDGKTILRHTETDTIEHWEVLGQSVAAHLRTQGADRLLGEIAP